MTKRILVVDDSPLSRALLVKTIEQEGKFDVLAVDNGAEAIQLVRSTDFDCIFLDLSMPGLTGYDVLEEIGGGTVPVVIVTANGQRRTKERVLGLGAVAVLSKPPQPDVIRKVLYGELNV